MRNYIFIVVVFVACIWATTVTWAAWLEGSSGPAQPRPPVRPQPVPVVENALTRYVARLNLRRGHTHRGLTVYLLETATPADATNYRSMAGALAVRDLTITERPTARVPSVVMQNTGNAAVLLLSGEIIVGGKQNRTLRDDVLLPAHSARIEVPVLCVERGRWKGPHGKFEHKSSVAALDVRAGAARGATQAEVWKKVGAYADVLKHRSATSDLQALQSTPAVRKVLDDYRKGFAGCWRPQAVGMVVARYGRIVGADVFCNAAVFAKHRDRLLDSYALDCHVHTILRGRARHAVHVEDPRAFLARLNRARFTWQKGVGAGQLLRYTGGVAGHGVLRNAGVLHAGIFPRLRPIVRLPHPPIPVPMPRRLPERGR
jgi:ARG/rhodanese/phosphatase superfamily protein